MWPLCMWCWADFRPDQLPGKPSSPSVSANDGRPAMHGPGFSRQHHASAVIMYQTYGRAKWSLIFILLPAHVGLHSVAIVTGDLGEGHG